MKAQVVRSDAGIDATTRRPADDLTADACAMYRQALAALGQINMLAEKVKLAEFSHERATLAARMEAVRAQVGMAVGEIYRMACDAPRSIYPQVREAQAALEADARAVIWPQ